MTPKSDEFLDSALPLVYFPSTGAKSALLVANSLIVAFGVLGFLVFSIFSPLLHLPLRLLLMALALLWIFFGSLGARGAVRSKVILSASRIEVVDWRGTRSLLYSEILGRKRFGPRNPMIVFVPKTKGQKKVDISLTYGFQFDPVFQRWLGALPDLDAKEPSVSKTIR